jgi:hypothetical protein
MVYTTKPLLVNFHGLMVVPLFHVVYAIDINIIYWNYLGCSKVVPGCSKG